MQRGTIGARDMRSNRCVRFIENRDEIKRNRKRVRNKRVRNKRDKKNKYIEIKNILYLIIIYFFSKYTSII